MKLIAGLLLTIATGTLSCSEAPGEAIRLAPATLPLGLVAHWNFDEGSGSIVVDHSGNRRNGTMTGGNWVSDGRFGSALRFATGEMASVANFPNATNAFSVSAWVREYDFAQVADDDPKRWGTIVSTELGMTGGWEVMLERNQPTVAPNFAFWKGPNQGDFCGWTCACMQLGQWTHVAAVVDRNAQKFTFYVDGMERGSSTTAQGILAGSSTLTMGQYPAGGRDLDGDVDEIAIWSRALVPAEIEFLHTHALPPVE